MFISQTLQTLNVRIGKLGKLQHRTLTRYTHLNLELKNNLMKKLTHLHELAFYDYSL